MRLPYYWQAVYLFTSRQYVNIDIYHLFKKQFTCGNNPPLCHGIASQHIWWGQCSFYICSRPAVCNLDLRRSWWIRAVIPPQHIWWIHCSMYLWCEEGSWYWLEEGQLMDQGSTKWQELMYSSVHFVSLVCRLSALAQVSFQIAREKKAEGHLLSVRTI